MNGTQDFPSGWYTMYSVSRPPLGLFKSVFQSGLKDHFWTVPRVVSYKIYQMQKVNKKKFRSS